MIISLNIPAPLVTRINNVLPRLGYVYDSANTGSTDPQQKQAFVKTLLINQLSIITLDQERGLIDDAVQQTIEQTRRNSQLSASVLPAFDTGSIT
jgi:hypothetical protein